jgi:anti-sigma regulatory factor (Ser/Thr protein kinase)
MCRIAKAGFAAEPSAPSAARAWMTGLLDRWEASSLSETAALLTSELVSNAVRHARSGPAITAAMTDGFLEVGVTDGGMDGVPHVLSIADPTAVSGRGMAIVEALAADWGVNVLPEAKQVWFRLEAADWTFLASCRCHGGHGHKAVLASGHEVLANAGPWDDAS